MQTFLGVEQHVSCYFYCFVINPSTVIIIAAHSLQHSSSLTLCTYTTGEQQPTASTVSTPSPVPTSVPSNEQPTSHTLGRGWLIYVCMRYCHFMVPVYSSVLQLSDALTLFCNVLQYHCNGTDVQVNSCLQPPVCLPHHLNHRQSLQRNSLLHTF